jgi:hypothetical protein
MAYQYQWQRNVAIMAAYQWRRRQPALGAKAGEIVKLKGERKAKA